MLIFHIQLLKCTRMSKMTFSDIFCSFSGVLKIFEEMLKNFQIFSSFSTPWIFSTKKWRQQYLIFISKYVLQNATVSKNNFPSFLSIFTSLETIWRTIKQPSNFLQMSHSMCIFYREKLEMYYFNVHPKKCTRKCKTVKKFNHFGPFSGALQLFREILRK